MDFWHLIIFNWTCFWLHVPRMYIHMQTVCYHVYISPDFEYCWPSNLTWKCMGPKPLKHHTHRFGMASTSGIHLCMYKHMESNFRIQILTTKYRHKIIKYRSLLLKYYLNYICKFNENIKLPCNSSHMTVSMSCLF